MAKPKAPLLAEAPSIATSAELLARLRARPKPTTELQLTPQGWEAAEVRRNVNTLAENRIKFLETRLDRARQTFANYHAKALVKGKAKGDFERGK